MPYTKPSIYPCFTEPVALSPVPDKSHSELYTPGVANVRLVGLLVSLGCLLVLLLAWHLEPAHLPLGSQSQLSLPGCALQQRTGYPCPTCGMTTAWAKTVRGQLSVAFQANLAGTVLALACAVAVFAGLVTAIAGNPFYQRFVQPLFGLLSPRQWLYLVFALIIFAWAWKAFWAFFAAHASSL